MSGFIVYLTLGFRHITDPAAIDHMLFLIALVAPYRFRNWRHLLAVASAFTLGHSITLGLVVIGAVRLPTAFIEFLIPLTIAGAGIEALRRSGQPPTGWVRPLLAAGFGLIHGAGFANFLGQMAMGPVALPLLAFNFGIELGQIVILVTALGLLAGVDRMVAPRIRVVATSLLVVVWAAVLAAHRAPW